MPVGLEMLQLMFLRANKHVIGEQVAGWFLTDHPNAQSVTWIGTGITITDVQFGEPVHIAGYRFMDLFEAGWFNGPVEFVPVDIVPGQVIQHDVFVFRTTPR